MMTILSAVSKLPDDKFTDILSNPEQIQVIREQVYSPIKSKNVRTDTGKMNKAEIENCFNVSLTSAPNDKYEIEDHNTDRQIINVAIAYYKSRIDATPERNRGLLRKAVECFRQGDGIDWINQTCNTAGIVSPVTAQDPTPNKPARKKADMRKAKSPAVSRDTAKTMPEISAPAPDPVQPVPVSASLEPVPSYKAVPEYQVIDTPEENISCISKESFWDYSTAKEIMSEEPEPYLIQGMFRKGSIVTIAATQNAGKTLLLLDIMGAVASGANFLPTKNDGSGGFETTQGACVLIDFEGDRSDTASRLIATIDTYCEATGLEPKDIPVLVKYMPIDWEGNDNQFPEKIYKAVSALPDPYNKPAVIAFDTYTAFSNVENENDSAQAQHVFTRFKKLRSLFADANTTIFITQHMRKLNGKSFDSIDMEDIRGASGTAGATSDIWMLAETKEDKTIKKFRQVKNKARVRDDETKVIQFRYENNNDGSLSQARFFMLTGTDAKQAQEKETQRKLKNSTKRENDVIAFIASHPNCSLSRIWKKEYPDRLQVTFNTLKPMVDKLIAEGKLLNLSPDESGYILCVNRSHESEY